MDYCCIYLVALLVLSFGDVCVDSFDLAALRGSLSVGIGNARKLLSSNCIMIERGNMPPYQKCEGCVVQDAVACLTDMRSNASGNVAGDCKMNQLYNRERDFARNIKFDSQNRKYLTETDRDDDGDDDNFVEDPRDALDDDVYNNKVIAQTPRGGAEDDIDPCCPRFVSLVPNRITATRVPRLTDEIGQLHSAYPDAFKCLIRVGCESSEFWVDLVTECKYLCDRGSQGIYPSSRNRGGSLSVCGEFPDAAPARFSRDMTTTLVAVVATSIGLVFFSGLQ